MKVFIIIFCLFISMDALAQSDSLQKDTSKKFTIVDAKPIKQPEKVLYIINEMPRYNILIKKDLDINNILYINVLKPSEATSKYGSKAADGAVVIVYKAFAIKAYQKKLSGFSKQYKTYLSTHQNQDKDFQYELNGLTLEDDYFDNIKKLYKIPVESIKRVDFLKNPSHNGYSGKTEIINILTK
jgi:hypothetical protein